MDSLYKLRDMKNLQKLCVAHCHELEHEHLYIDAYPKIQEMIDTRMRKDKRMLDTFKVSEV
jgi:hypothetical protein